MKNNEKGIWISTAIAASAVAAVAAVGYATTSLLDKNRTRPGGATDNEEKRHKYIRRRKKQIRRRVRQMRPQSLKLCLTKRLKSPLTMVLSLWDITSRARAQKGLSLHFTAGVRRGGAITA